MSEFKGTPVPWFVSEGVTHITVRGDNGEVIFHDDKRINRVREDARLIAAAPELLEALKDLVKANEDHNEAVSKVLGVLPDWKDSYLDKARAAISLALGE